MRLLRGWGVEESQSPVRSWDLWGFTSSVSDAGGTGLKLAVNQGRALPLQGCHMG